MKSSKHLDFSELNSTSRWVHNQEEGTIMLEATTLVPPTLCLTAGSEMIAVDIFSSAGALVVITV